MDDPLINRIPPPRFANLSRKYHPFHPIEEDRGEYSHFNGLQLRGAGMIIATNASRFRESPSAPRPPPPPPPSLLSVQTRELLSTELVRIDLSAEC